MTRPAVDTRLTASQYDAKKAELEAKLALAITATHQLSVAANDSAADEKRIKDDLAALGPRPAERSVTWRECAWTWDGEWFMRICRGCAVHGPLGVVLHNDVPLDVALRVLLLAWPEEPVRWMNVYKGEYGEYSTWRTEEDARTCAAKEALEVAVPLYRIPVGIATGVCVVVDGKVQATFSTVRTDPHAALAHAKKFASNFDGTVYDLIAVPRKEAT